MAKVINCRGIWLLVAESLPALFYFKFDYFYIKIWLFLLHKHFSIFFAVHLADKAWIPNSPAYNLTRFPRYICFKVNYFCITIINCSFNVPTTLSWNWTVFTWNMTIFAQLWLWFCHLCLNLVYFKPAIQLKSCFIALSRASICLTDLFSRLSVLK